MIRCVSCGDSRIASVLTTATTGDFGSMGGCVFTVSRRPSDSSDNPHFPQARASRNRFSISYSVTATSGDWGGSIIALWTHILSQVTSSLIRRCPLLRMRESRLLSGWTTPSPSAARTLTMYSPGFAGAKWYLHIVQTLG